MARNDGYRNQIPAGYELAYGPDGGLVVVPSTPAPQRSALGRISQGISEGYGPQELARPTPEEYAQHPILSTMYEPVQMGLDAARRSVGAVTGGLAGAAGAGAQLLTNDTGIGNEAEKAARSAMEYFATRGMAEPGMTPSGAIARNGEVLPPVRGPQGQLGYAEPTTITQYPTLAPGSIRGTSAEGAPRLAPPNPLTSYRPASGQGQRIGPNQPSAALRPVVDQTYTVPQEVRPVSETTAPSSVVRLGDESPLQADRQGAFNATQRANEAAFRANQAATATGEGMFEPNPPVGRLRTQQPQFVGPNQPPSVSVDRSYVAPQTASDIAYQQFLKEIGQGASGPAAGSLAHPISDPMIAKAMSSVRSGAASEPVDIAKLLNDPTQNYRLAGEQGQSVGPKQPYSMSIDRSYVAPSVAEAPAPASGPWGSAAPEQVTGTSVPSYQPSTPRTGAEIDEINRRMAAALQAGVATTGAGAAAYKIRQNMQANQPPAAGSDQVPAGYTPNYDDFHRMFSSAPGQTAPAQDQFFGTGANEFFAPSPEAAPSSRGDRAYTAVNTARQVAARAPAPAAISSSTSAPASAPAQPQSGGLFSRIFSGPDYQSTGDTVAKPGGGVNWGSSENAADFFRAARLAQQLQDQQNASGSSDDAQPRASGGKVDKKPSKEAMLHKSLEIIHHMLKNQHR